MLIRDTPENDLKQRILDLEEYVGNIEKSRCSMAVQLDKLQKRLDTNDKGWDEVSDMLKKAGF